MDNDDQYKPITIGRDGLTIQLLHSGTVEIGLPFSDGVSPTRKEIKFPNCDVVLHLSEEGTLERIGLSDIKPANIPTPEDYLPPIE